MGLPGCFALLCGGAGAWSPFAVSCCASGPRLASCPTAHIVAVGAGAVVVVGRAISSPILFLFPSPIPSLIRHPLHPAASGRPSAGSKPCHPRAAGRSRNDPSSLVARPPPIRACTDGIAGEAGRGGTGRGASPRLSALAAMTPAPRSSSLRSAGKAGVAEPNTHTFRWCLVSAPRHGCKSWLISSGWMCSAAAVLPLAMQPVPWRSRGASAGCMVRPGPGRAQDRSGAAGRLPRPQIRTRRGTLRMPPDTRPCGGGGRRAAPPRLSVAVQTPSPAPRRARQPPRPRASQSRLGHAGRGAAIPTGLGAASLRHTPAGSRASPASPAVVRGCRAVRPPNFVLAGRGVLRARAEAVEWDDAGQGVRGSACVGKDARTG